MEGKTYQLGDVVNCLDYKRVPLSSKVREDRRGIYPYYGAQGIVDYVDDYIFDGTYLLVAEDGENLRSQNEHIANLASGKYWVNNHAHILESNGKCDIRFVCYYLNNLDIRGYITGSAQPKLNQDNLLSIKLLLPDLKEQTIIADVLDGLDKKIALNTRMNAELEAMAKQLYDYWFVQFDFPDENGNPYKSSGGKMVYNPTLKREIPAGWEVRNIFEVADILYGFPFATECFVDYPTEKPIIRIRDIMDNSFSAYTIEEVDELYRLKEGDLVIGMDGNFHMNFWHDNNCFLNQRCVRLRDIPEFPLSTFQLYYNIKPILEHKQRLIQGSTVGHLLDSDIKEFWIVCPDINRSKDIKGQFDSYLHMITKNKKELLYLTHLRDSLLPMLMNGQVTI